MTTDTKSFLGNLLTFAGVCLALGLGAFFLQRNAHAKQELTVNLAIANERIARQNDQLAAQQDAIRFCALAVIACQEEVPADLPEPQATPQARIREVTAYNVGDPRQNDDTPCIGAAGTDLCAFLAQGGHAVATNELPLHSRVTINGTTYTVLDRMNARYQHRYDIAMPLTANAHAFGVQRLAVTPL